MRYFINVYAVFKRKYSSTTGAQLNKSAIVMAKLLQAYF